MSQGVKSYLPNNLIHDISLLVLLLHICCINKIWWAPADISNAMRRGAYDASETETDVVKAAIAIVTCGKLVFYSSRPARCEAATSLAFSAASTRACVLPHVILVYRKGME